MEEWLLVEIKKDNLEEYIKMNSGYIKELMRYPEHYEKIKKEIKEKYKLRLRDKVSGVIDDIELVSSIINTIN